MEQQITLHIKNMVCIRCILMVKAALGRCGIPYATVKIGEVELLEKLDAGQFEKLSAILKKSGLEILDDWKSILVERIKILIIDIVHYSDDPEKQNLSGFLSSKLNYDYTYLSNLFSSVKGTTIEQYFIHQRIERVKELLVYDELNLNEIAKKLHFSSASHLCRQFKKVTGLTPLHFKRFKNYRRRTTIENL